jgi:glycosyltransferase involved in cell wall biosynthesis
MGQWSMVCQPCDTDSKDRILLQKTLIIVPVHDEWPHVAGVLEDLRSRFPNIVVVEDGASEEALKSFCKARRIDYIALLFNLGVWPAIQIGFRYALLKGYDAVVTFDGDGQHLPEEIEKLIAPLDLGYDIVVGSCLERGGFLKKTCWLILRKLSGIGICDVTSGFRAYGRSAFQRFAQTDHADLEYQDLGVLILAQRLGLNCTEVCTRMSERLAGCSKVFPGARLVLHYLLTTLVSVVIKWR